MDDRRRSLLRYLAPVVLVVFTAAFFAILLGTGGSDDSDRSSGTADEQRQRDLGKSNKKKQRQREGKLPQKTYTVQSGDTLGSIADKTGIPVDKLQELNPELDPQALVAGQRIKLRE